MPDSYFLPIDDDPFEARWASRPATAGPWHPGQQHGGPPNALAVAVAERALATTTGRSDFTALRLASDFVGPVPVAEVTTRARVVRAARSAALVEVVLSAAGRDCLIVRVWFVRASDTTAIAPTQPDEQPVPDIAEGLDAQFPYAQSVEWRLLHGGMSQLGPGAAWARPRTALVAGYEYSGLARTVLIADSASGLSAALDWTEWTFLNVDLDVHLARPMHGDWLLLDATTQLSDSGSGLARSTVSDSRGPLGSGLQTLVVAPIRR